MKYTVLDFLEETAKKYPDKIAFSDVNNKITFSELVRNAKIISSKISKYFVPGCAVPVMIEKSVKTIEYFFGALYSGCFYSYFDATFPQSRLNSMLETLDAKFIIADSRYSKKIAELNINPLFYQDLEAAGIQNEYTDERRNQIIDTDPVYANFTSGSTGVPKAVVVGHKSVIDFISCFTELFDIRSDDNIGNQAPFDFDVSVKDIFSGIFTGATVYLIPKMFFSFPTKLLDFLDDNNITILIWAVSALCIISTLNGFDYKIPSKLRKIMFSGEVMPYKHLKIWKEKIPAAEFINLYGPTEITCNCTYYRIPKNECPEIIPIGKPFPNERIILLDNENKQVFEQETEGEICVSGTCVSLGYYNSEKTKDVFIQNPNNNRYFERIYKTGDLGKIGKDGLYYYIGRIDNQIKHMGHRIELGEIEKVVTNHQEISRAVCVFENNMISVFYTGVEIEKKEIVNFLKSSLPTFMIPSNFIFIKDFPLTKNGKVDKKQLVEMLKND